MYLPKNAVPTALEHNTDEPQPSSSSTPMNITSVAQLEREKQELVWQVEEIGHQRQEMVPRHQQVVEAEKWEVKMMKKEEMKEQIYFRALSMPTGPPCHGDPPSPAYEV